MIGSLLYLIASKPDIQLCVPICARFQSDPKQSHFNAVKRILKCLVGTIWYEKDTFYDVTSYCDADFAGDRVEIKSISSYYCFLENP